MTHSPIWHPFTQHAIFPEALEIERASGVYLHARDGRRIVDGISSWWVNIHGHCHPKIVQAVQAQAGALDQVIFAGLSHEPAEKLARGLLAFVHGSLGDLHQHVFFSDSGSTAVEVALKMAIGFYAHKGETRRKIVALEGGYHGDTFGTMSAGARGVYSRVYEPYLFEPAFLPFPDPSGDGAGENTLSAFRALLENGAEDIAALIVEPLVQGAGGMRMYGPEVLRGLYDLCRAHGILMIADEVMTGFGRTGTKFACEQAGICPDLLCLSKGLTGGFLPMGATLASRDIFDAFYDQDRSRMFFHSSSFTGNPMACAAALASLRIWKEEPVEARIDAVHACHMRTAERFRGHPMIADARVCGTILALDLVDPDGGYLSDLAPVLYRFYLKHDVLLRPLGNCVYVLPPYCISEEELERIYECITRSLDYIRDAGREPGDGSAGAAISG